MKGVSLVQRSHTPLFLPPLLSSSFLCLQLNTREADQKRFDDNAPLREDQLGDCLFLALSDDALVEILSHVSFTEAMRVRSACKYTRAFVPQSFASVDLPGLVPDHVEDFCKLVEVSPCLRSIKLQCTCVVLHSPSRQPSRLF